MSDGKFPQYYILNNRVPFAVDLMTWAKWFGDFDNRFVAHTIIDPALDIRVSTVFLGLDHNFGGGEPVLFETMAFHGKDDLSCDRYSTWMQAEAGHARIVTEIAALMADSGATTD